MFLPPAGARIQYRDSHTYTLKERCCMLEKDSHKKHPLVWGAAPKKSTKNAICATYQRRIVNDSSSLYPTRRASYISIFSPPFIRRRTKRTFHNNNLYYLLTKIKNQIAEMWRLHRLLTNILTHPHRNRNNDRIFDRKGRTDGWKEKKKMSTILLGASTSRVGVLCMLSFFS